MPPDARLNNSRLSSFKNKNNYLSIDRIIAIDPGLTKVAYAEFSRETGSLASAGLATCDHEATLPRAQKWREMAWWATMEIGLDNGSEINLVVEIPQVYSKISKIDPNDLIDLAGVVGA